MQKHNRLKLCKAYEVGPIDYDRASGKIWREDMSEWLKSRGAIPINPYLKNEIMPWGDGLEDDEAAITIEAAKSIGDYNTVATMMHAIRVADLRIVDISDVLIVNLDLDKRPCGTLEEIFLANRSKKPVIVCCPQGVEEINHWLRGTLPMQFFFDDWSKVKEYLRHIDEDEVIDTLGRWRFFDFEPLIREVLELPERKE